MYFLMFIALPILLTLCGCGLMALGGSRCTIIGIILFLCGLFVGYFNHVT